VVADSDVEVETTTSIHANAMVCTDEAVKVLGKAETSMATVDTEETIKFVNKAETSMDHAAIKSEDSGVMNYRDNSYGMTVRRDKVDESECGNADVIYGQNLVVRDMDITSGVSSATNNRVPNFKLFRKVVTLVFLFVPVHGMGFQIIILTFGFLVETTRLSYPLHFLACGNCKIIYQF
jgi:hypothetical protein